MNWGCFTLEPVLAAWSDLGNRFSGRHAELHWADIATMLGVVVGGLGFVAVLYVLQLRQQRRAISNEPVHLFQDLCAVHDLGWKERRLLMKLAQGLDLNIPAILFVSPHLFDPEQLPPELSTHEMTLQRIADKIFAGLEEPTQTSSPPTTDVRQGATEETASLLPLGAFPSAGEMSTVDSV